MTQPAPDAPGSDDAGARWKPLSDLVMALRFFSRLPTGPSPHEKPDMGRIATALPLASLVIGLIPAALLVGAAWLNLPPYFAATLAVAAMVIVGGGMMEDSLADAADGLFGGHNRERRLEILKDSRHGTYGVAALCLFLLLRVTALGALTGPTPLAAASIWLAANIAGRSGALWLAVVLPPARAEGASAAAGGLDSRRFFVGAAMALVLAGLLAIGASGVLGLATAFIAVALVVVGWAAICRRLVGGQTGDLIGAAAGLGEVAALCALLIFV